MIFDTMVLAPSIRELIDLGHLVPPEYYAPSRPDLSKLKIRCGDYVKEGVADVMDRPQMVGDIVTNYAKICPDRKAIVFATSVKHSKHIAERFIDAGIPAAHIDGKTPKEERDQILKDLASGKIQIVVNCMVLTEGFDCPSVGCIILARPTKSLGFYIQMAGRGLRPDKDKDNCIIIDHSGAVYQHGFVDVDHEWSLDPQERIEDRQSKAQREKAGPITCKECNFLYEGRPDCPKCGWQPVTQGKSFDFQEGELGRIDRDGLITHFKETREQKERFYQELVFIQQERGYKPGWVAFKYKERYGKWPRGLMDKPAIPSVETRSWIRKEAVKYARQQKVS
jgi:DNA repair protein RadD